MEANLGNFPTFSFETIIYEIREHELITSLSVLAFCIDLYFING
jgi:hypothetical protein